MSRVLKAACVCDQGLESACVDKVDCKSFRQQQAQVEVIAHSVSVLSEEMRSRDAQIHELKCVAS